jgi:DNA polymerase-1
MPERILDLFTEFRALSNGLPTVAGSSLLGALTHFGLDNIGATEKEDMRELVLGGGPWSEQAQADILDYCESDVDALKRLLPAMLPTVDLPRALLRGRYMAAVAQMEHNGIPIDTMMLDRLRCNWSSIQDQLIAAIDRNYGVFEGRTFKADRFAAWLARNHIPWPRLDSGRLDLEDGTFRQMAKAHPVISPLRELRSSLADLRLADLAVGDDGRNRTLLSPFRARTGRNQPSNSKFIFGSAVWLRSLIKPSPGYAVAYVDWSQQEFALPLRCRATWLCKQPITAATHTSPLLSKHTRYLTTRRRRLMALRASCSSSACLRRNTAWKPKPLPYALASLRLWPGISYGPTERHIAHSGDGPMRP